MSVVEPPLASQLLRFQGIDRPSFSSARIGIEGNLHINGRLLLNNPLSYEKY
jgi:hypothetical protein